MVQLKRFAYGRTLSDKLTARVDFPLRGLVLESPVWSIPKTLTMMQHACLPCL